MTANEAAFILVIFFAFMMVVFMVLWYRAYSELAAWKWHYIELPPFSKKRNTTETTLIAPNTPKMYGTKEPSEKAILASSVMTTSETNKTATRMRKRTISRIIGRLGRSVNHNRPRGSSVNQ